MPCFEKQGGYSVIEVQTYLYYIQMTTHVSLPSTDKWVPYNDEIEKTIVGDFKRLWGTNFLDDLVGRGARRALLERRHRQGRRLQHGGAAAGQDRRLRRHPQGRPVEDRRQAEREAAPDPARLVHRSRPAAARRRRGARGLRLRGVPVRRGEAGGQGDRGRAEAGERHLQHHRGAEGPHPRDRVRRQQGDQRRLAAPADEGEQGRRLLLVHPEGRHLQGREVRRRRPEPDRLLPRSRATCARRWASPI